MTFRNDPDRTAPAPIGDANWREELFFLLTGAILTATAILLRLFFGHDFALGEWNFFVIFGLLSALGPLIALCFKSSPPSDEYRGLRFAIFFLWSSGAMLTLPSSRAVFGMLVERPVSTTVLAAAAIFFSLIILQAISGAGTARLRGWRVLFSVVPWLLFYLFAKRTDSMAAVGSYHWEYFVGPLRALRSGGALLWDTPSQYGFLSALVPAWLPFSSAWSAFYWFQSGLFLITAGIYYLALTRPLGLSRIIACILVIGTFFLADPSLIGPGPFPSSSAARFVWCYAMLFLAAESFLGPKPAMARYLWLGGILWTVSIFWSAESALYNTAIFWAPISLHVLLVAFGNENQGPPVLKCILTPLVVLCGALLLSTIAYAYIVGVWPDFSLMFVYANAYAAGFGSLDIRIYGAVWFFCLLIVTSSFALRLVLGREANACGPAGALISALGCILIVSSYYLGRAIANNVVAIYPLLVLSLLIVLRATAKGAQITVSQYALALPILVVAVLSPFWNNSLSSVVAGVFARQAEVATTLTPASDELRSLLKSAEVTPDRPLVYYAYNPQMPTVPASDGRPLTFEKTWLPSPLQLLEKPISASRRDQVVDRFVARNGGGGYLVWHRGDTADRFADWLTLLQRHFSLKQTWSSENYRIFYFVPVEGRGQTR